mmetsp:Transcript_41573/g.130206  ORF Transcript_41573/g.130206 Transcript_41573/m.130206 type:complete len:379 (-) Transcript_41573:84-1220(-)
MNGADGEPLGGAVKKVITDWDGVKVGIIGASENWLPGCSKLAEGEAAYLDVIEESNRLCAEMRAEGVEVILAVTHSRLENDKAYAAAVPEVDLVLGGHDHFPYLDLQARIIKGGQEFEYCNAIEIKVKGNGKKVVKCRQIPILAAVEEDAAAQAIVKVYDDLVEAKMSGVIGATPVALESTEEFLRFKESELGNFVADVMCENLGADLGVIQGFEVAGKYVLDAGEIKVGDVYSWFPKGTTVISVKLTGAEIKELLEAGVRSLPGECGAFEHVSRRVRYVMDAARAPGARVSAATIDGAPIADGREYAVAITTNLGSARGYGTDFVAEAPRVVDEEFERPLTALLLGYFRDRGVDNPIDTTEPHKCGRVIEIASGEAE